MRPEDRIQIEHTSDAAVSVTRLVAGRRREDLDVDETLRFALVRAVEIFTAAASKISGETQSAHPEIPWKAIIGMRDRLVHAYVDTDTDLLWVAAMREIPALSAQLQAAIGAG